jgi:predicted DNA-binding transcriptional regulator YafY
MVAALVQPCRAWTLGGSMTHVADIITAAARNERVIRFWFMSRTAREPMIRTVSPYELSDDGESFLGFDHDRQAIRRFSLSGIVTEDIELPDEDYVKPIDQEV